MARPLRLHVPGAMYHVTLRGNHRRDIFFCATDRLRMNELFADSLERCEARLHAYCYMTNHVHALIQVSDVPLGRLVLRVAGQYARCTQARLETSGHLFERRYHPVLIDTERYLLALLRYIHLNPVAAGLAHSPGDYPWSSHHVYQGDRAESWVTTDLALSLFSVDRCHAIDAYRRFMLAGMSLAGATSPLEERNPHDPRILGSDDFARRMLGPAWRPRSPKSLAQLCEEACRHFAVAQDKLLSSSREAQVVAARAWVAQEALRGRIASLAAVARFFGRDESSLRRAVSRRSAPQAPMADAAIE